MKFHSRWAATALFAVAFLLSGCGGGGGGGSSAAPAPAPTPTPANVSFLAFPAGYFSNGYTETYQMSGGDTAGGTHTATFSRTTLAQTTFNGQAAIPQQQLVKITNTSTGYFITVTSTHYYSTDSTSRMYLGYREDDTGINHVAVSLNVLPQRRKDR